MSAWTVVRYLHLLAVAFFVGGQLLLAVAVTPVLRHRADPGVVLAVARRFGIGSAVALAVLVATGAAMASHYSVWDAPTLHVKLAVLAAVVVLTGLHVVSSRRRAISLAVLAGSLVVAYLGVRLAHG